MTANQDVTVFRQLLLNTFNSESKMAFVKPNKPSGSLHKFSQRDLFSSSSSHGNLSEHLTVMLLSTQMTTPGISSVSAAGWTASANVLMVSGTMSHAGCQQHCIKI